MSEALSLELLDKRQQMLTNAHDVLRADLQSAVTVIDGANSPVQTEIERLTGEIRGIMASLSRMSAALHFLEDHVQSMDQRVDMLGLPQWMVPGVPGDAARHTLEGQLRVSRTTWSRH